MTLKRLSFIAVISGFATTASAAVPEITCEDIGAAIGAPLAEMAPDPSSDPAWIDNPDAYQIICSWVTQPALRMMQGHFPDAEALNNLGQVSVQLFAHKDAAKVSKLRGATPVHPLPFDTPVPDAWIFAMTGPPDYSEAAGAMPPELYLGALSASISTLPLGPGMPASFAPLTKGWSVEAGLRVIHMAAERLR